MRVLAIALLSSLTSCGASSGTFESSADVRPGRTELACTLSGRAPSIGLLAPAGYSTARAIDAAVTLELFAGADGTPRLSAQVDDDGYHLWGAPSADGEVYAAHPLTLGPLRVPPAGPVRVLELGSAGVRVGPAPPSFDGVTFMQPAEAWVGCDDLGVSSALSGDGSGAQERATLDLPPSTGERHLHAGAQAELLSAPGGPVVVRLGPSDYPQVLAVLETRAGFVRVALNHGQGGVVTGWAADDSLATEPVPEAEVTDQWTVTQSEPTFTPFTVCTTRNTVQLSVRQRARLDPATGVTENLPPNGPLSELGTMDAGASFVVLETRADGTTRIEPARSVSVHVDEHAEWVAQTSELGTPSCQELQPDTVGPTWPAE